MFFFQNKQDNQEVAPSTILKTLPTAVLFIQERKILYANEAIKHIFGYESNEVVGKEIRILYRTDAEYEAIGKLIYDKLEVDSTHKGIYPYRTKDEKDIICEVNAARVDNQLQKKRVVVVFEDITERIAAEKELSESEDKYRNLLENTHDIIMSVSPEGKFIHVNNAWYTTFGYTPLELPSLTIKNILQGANLQMFNDQFAKALKNESTKNMDIPFLSKNGASVILQGNLVPKSFYDKIVAVWGFYRDVTEQKKDQEEIQNKIQELERFNKMVIDRELKMVELKEAIKKLQEQLANPRKDYP
jgi:PAS domain S-box-containing protein